MAKRVLITGGTGNIGKFIAHILTNKGYRINILSRRKVFSSHKVYIWDIEKEEIDLDAFQSVDYIIHLAGESIAKGRWTESRKSKLYNSRIKTTELLYRGLKDSGVKVKSIVCASAIGLYDHTDFSVTHDESSKKGDGFIPNLVAKWEDSQKPLQDFCSHLVNLRIGLVLDFKSGILKALSPIVKSNLASPIGSGKQIMNWIHINDLGRLVIAILNDEISSGAINAVAPNPVDNKSFILAYAKFLNRPCFMPRVPTFIFKLLFGEKSAIMTEGSKVISNKLNQSAFDFKYKELDDVFIYKK